MPFTIDPELIENDDVRVTTDNNDNLVIENKRTGDTIDYTSGGELTVDSLNSNSVSTDESVTRGYQPNSGMSPWSNRRLQAQRRIPLPNFKRDPDNPKLHADNVSWTSELHFPSIIPSGKTAITEAHAGYFSPHNVDGVGIVGFDDPFGNWTQLNDGSPIITDAGRREPEALYDVASGDVWLYVNGPNDDITLYSGDGLSMTQDTTAFEGSDISANGGHAGYPRALRANGDTYIYSFWKPSEDYLGMGLHHSPDGKTNWTHNAVHWLNQQEPTGTTDRRYAQISSVPYFGGYLTFYADQSDLTANPTSTIRYGYTENGIHIRDLGVALGTTNPQSWEDSGSGANLQDPEPFWGRDGNLYLAYAAGSSPSGDGLGIARADFAEAKL